MFIRLEIRFVQLPQREKIASQSALGEGDPSLLGAGEASSGVSSSWYPSTRHGLPGASPAEGH